LTTPLQAEAVLDVAVLLDVLDENVVMVEKLEDLEEELLLEAVTVMYEILTLILVCVLMLMLVLMLVTAPLVDCKVVKRPPMGQVRTPPRPVRQDVMVEVV
jgi:hypothetical protein